MGRGSHFVYLKNICDFSLEHLWQEIGGRATLAFSPRLPLDTKGRLTFPFTVESSLSQKFWSQNSLIKDVSLRTRSHLVMLPFPLWRALVHFWSVSWRDFFSLVKHPSTDVITKTWHVSMHIFPKTPQSLCPVSRAHRNSRSTNFPQNIEKT